MCSKLAPAQFINRLAAVWSQERKYFRQSVLNTQFHRCIFCLLCYSCMHASFHVDTKAQERQLTEAEETEVKYQEPEPGSYEIKGPESEQYEGAEQDQAYDYVDYT